MLRSLLVVLACVCACNALSLRTLKKGDDEQHYIVPAMADLDGTGKDTSAPGAPEKTYKPKYTEFSASETDTGAEMMSGKTFKPTYKKVLPEMETPSITKGFCAGVLKAIEAKEAPYFINGESSGEMRSDLISQCGMMICEWGVDYRKLVDTCASCPKSCDGEFDSKEFFNSLLSDEAGAEEIIKAILHLSGEKEGKSVELTVEKAEKEAEEEVGEIDIASLGGKGGHTDVTRGFCLEVLQGVKDKKAPYYVDGQATGEARKDLIGQCADRVCEWSNTYKSLIKAGEPCPMGDTAGKEKYVISMMADGEKLGELLLHSK